MGDNYNKEFMSTGKEVSQIADALRNKGKPSKPSGGGNKKKKVLIILLLLLLLVGAGVAGFFIYSSSRMNVEFYVKNVNAGVRVWGQVLDSRTSTVADILVDNKKEEYVSFAPEDMGDRGQINKNISFSTNAKIGKNSIVQFFYEIENRSTYSDMFVDFTKAKSNDDNFVVRVYYRSGRDAEVTALTYYAKDGKYYMSESDLDDLSKGRNDVSLSNDIRISKREKLTMRIEVQVYNPNKEASCNCNFSINMVNQTAHHN